MWLQTAIWEQLPETRAWGGPLALLEEDHLVTPDYLEVPDLPETLKLT